MATYNCLGHTKTFLDSLRATVDLSANEVILIDDGSNDGTREYLSGLPSPPFFLELNNANLGYAKSNNRGAQKATGEYLCFLNNDLVLTPGWLSPMVGLILDDESVGAIGNVQVHPVSEQIDHAGVYFDHRGRPRHVLAPPQGPGLRSFSEWNAATAACLLMRKSVFWSIGGFDESYVNGYEDVDLCVRLRLKGYRILVSHESIVKHHGRSSPGRRRYNRANLSRFLSRWQSVTRQWGREEWPAEYLRHCRNRWWTINPLSLSRALWMVSIKSGRCDDDQAM